MKKQIFIIGIVFIAFMGILNAQGVSFKASAKNVVRIGERFNLIYTLSADGSNFKGPDIEDFVVVTGPHTSQNSSMQIINGRVSQTFELTFTYILSAQKEGIFDIPPAEVTVDGKKIKSNAVKVQVVKNTAQQQNTQGVKGNTNSGTSASEQLKDDVFIRVVADKKSPLQGEQVIVTYKLYYRVNISAPQFEKEPSFRGFWVKDLMKDRQSYVQYQETYKGKQFHVAEIKKVALFPQRSGDMVIEPASAVTQAQLKTQGRSSGRSGDPFFDNFFNDPFFNRVKNVDVNLKTNRLTLHVKPLPTSNKPANFSGAVGDFRLNSSCDKTELKANEALNLKFTISGKGNVELADIPEINFPPDFEVYDPKISKNISVGQNGVNGKKTFEYLIIPRNQGEFKIPAIKFSYYNLNKKKYVTLTSPEYTIHVAKGDGSAANTSFTGVDHQDVKYLGKDIRHIKTQNPGLMLIGTFFYGSTLFYVFIFVPLFLFILFISIWKKELKKRSNLALMRNRKATKVAQKRLKTAHAFLRENKKDEFYIELSQAIWGYLSDKFSIPLSNLSMDTVSESLAKKEVKAETVQQFITTLNNCEFARFAPGDSTSTMENLYNEAVNVISKMENELK
ncbi:MAG: protein BatD [Chlorobi bacterium]|nr:protein BatD [Chlorobiota bacterium]